MQLSGDFSLYNPFNISRKGNDVMMTVFTKAKLSELSKVSSAENYYL